MRHLVVLLALAGAVAAATGLAGAAQPDGGLHGIVMRGPTKPVCRVGERCEAPAAGVVLVFRRPSVRSIAGRVTTRKDGTYRIALAAGTYAVRTQERPGIGAGLRPSLVRVPRHRFARLDFHLDTGIR